MKILILNPFHGGSHKSWAEGLLQYSKHEISCLSLPGRHWKWRMHAASIELSDRIKKESSIDPDVILCTDMLDLSLLKSLLPSELQGIPVVCYYHENQITYPWSASDPDPELQRDNHYGFKNFTNAIVADHILFNSEYHKNEFLDALAGFLKAFPDYQGLHHIPGIKNKSSVLSPGVKNGSFSLKQKANTVPRIVWNHRWEYDKGPDRFLDYLRLIKDQNLDFELIILGESYLKYPRYFDVIKSEFEDQILHWGFVKDRQEYLKILATGDLLPIFSIQEFFGISLMEAILSGVYPLMPDRLVYPEHIPATLIEDYIYQNEEDLILKSKALLKTPKLPHPVIQKMAGNHLWENLIHKYDDYFSRIVLS